MEERRRNVLSIEHLSISFPGTSEGIQADKSERDPGFEPDRWKGADGVAVVGSQRVGRKSLLATRWGFCPTTPVGPVP